MLSLERQHSAGTCWDGPQQPPARNTIEGSAHSGPMPRNELKGLPFPPLRRLETDEPVTKAQLTQLLSKSPRGLSLCVRSRSGHENRGGYFFHLLPNRELTSCTLYDFEKTPVIDLKLSQAVALVNHCSGLLFSEECFDLCQKVVNFRQDPPSK